MFPKGAPVPNPLKGRLSALGKLCVDGINRMAARTSRTSWLCWSIEKPSAAVDSSSQAAESDATAMISSPGRTATYSEDASGAVVQAVASVRTSALADAIARI
jgi:hypothetical protein